MSDYGLIRPFDIDDGQLDGLSPQVCFVLGYECALIDELLKLPLAICKMIHAENQQRIEAQIRKEGRLFRFTWPRTDQSEGWVQLDVAPLHGPHDLSEF